MLLDVHATSGQYGAQNDKHTQSNLVVEGLGKLRVIPLDDPSQELGHAVYDTLREAFPAPMGGSEDPMTIMSLIDYVWSPKA